MKELTEVEKEKYAKNEEIRQRIIAQIAESGLSQKQLAEAIGIHTVTLNKALKEGNHRYSMKFLEDVAEALGVSVSDLTSTEEQPQKDDNVHGFLKFNGQVYDFYTLSKLKGIIKKIDEDIAKLNRVKDTRKLNEKGLKSLAKTVQPIFSVDSIRLRKSNPTDEEEYDTTKLNVWTFRKSEDMREGKSINLGNMCIGYPFAMDGVEFANSESAYICGMFSNDTPEHQQIQQLLIDEENGYSAKKEIRRKYEHLKRKDWEQFNVEWMLYVVWNKCINNSEFRNLLMNGIPHDATIIENSTRQKGETSTFWGAKNPELEENRDILEAYLSWKNQDLNSKALANLQMIERNKINTIGTFKGWNCMGKILKICQLCLISNTEPPINYSLLRSKDIYLKGVKVEF